MTMIASVYGRLGTDPVARQSKAGKDMATASLVVDLTGYNAEEPASQWFNVLAFGTAAEALLRGGKGEMCGCIGRVTRGTYTTAAGEVREQWSLLADSVVTAKSAKPSGRARPQGEAPSRGAARPQDRGAPTERTPPPFDDAIPS